MTKKKPPAKEDGRVLDPLRDEIAIRVMSTLISDAQAFVGEVTKSDMHARMSFSNVASISYGMADAMLEARKR